MDFIKRATTVPEKALKVSLLVNDLVAVKMILPACKIIVKEMLGPNAVAEVAKLPLSDNTIARRIENMSVAIKNSIMEKVRIGRRFALQVNESTDISGQAQLLANARFIDGKAIKDIFLFRKRLLENTNGEEIVRVTSDYF